MNKQMPETKTNGKLKNFFHSAFYGQDSEGTIHLSLLFAVVICALHVLIYFFFPQKLPEEHFLCKLVCNIDTIVIYHHDKGLVNHAIAFMYKYIIPFFGFIVAIKAVIIIKKMKKMAKTWERILKVYLFRDSRWFLKYHLFLAMLLLFYFIVIPYMNPYGSSSSPGVYGSPIRFNPESLFSELFFSLLLSWVSIAAVALTILEVFICCSSLLEQIKKLISLFFNKN